MENERSNIGAIEPTEKSEAQQIAGLKENAQRLEKEIKAKQIGAIRIYDGALSPEFCDELVEVFDANHELHENID